MAKIDVSLIEGYDELSAEEKIKALEGLEMPEPDLSGYVRKEVFDKTASELSEKKKELTQRMTEEEANKLKEEEERNRLQKNYDELLRKVTVTEHTKKLLGVGYPEDLATETAEALANGDFDKVFGNVKKHLTSFEKNLRAELLKDTPKPVQEGTQKGMTKEDLLKMNWNDRYKFSQEHPEEYKQIYGGNTDG